MSEYVKKRQFNCKGRARQWVENSTLIDDMLSHLGPGWKALFRNKILTAVSKLMREAYVAGYDAGYKEKREEENK